MSKYKFIIELEIGDTDIPDSSIEPIEYAKEVAIGMLESSVIKRISLESNDINVIEY